MKNSKKLIALVLAMVMIFALTASALAATDSTNNTIEVTVSVIKRYPSGMTPILSETVTLPTSATATSGTYTGDDWIFELYNGYMPVEVDNYLDYTPLQDGYEISLIYQTSNISW